MSGHSKWSTIKRQKAANDIARGKVFSKLARAITIAAKSGGTDPDTNYKLRVAIESARSENMPKQTIERAINKAGGELILEEVTYEGFAPGGVGILVNVATDNRNRTSQIIKNIFERFGGSLGGPGSVSFNFELKGYLLIEKDKDYESQILSLIDLGVEEMDEDEKEIEVFTNSQDLFNFKTKIEQKGFKVLKAQLVQKPKNFVYVDSKNQEKLLELIDELESCEDVTSVYDNVAINQ